jgi:plasmid stability protein
MLMATITVKNIPAELYDRLKAAARANRRSVNSEIIVCIEQAVAAHPTEPEAMLARARQLRRLTRGAPITDSDFGQAKGTGRP